MRYLGIESMVTKYCKFQSDEGSDYRCCTKAQDKHIRTTSAEIWPPTCSEVEFDGLAQFFCLACDPLQPKYTTVETKDKVD